MQRHRRQRKWTTVCLMIWVEARLMWWVTAVSKNFMSAEIQTTCPNIRILKENRKIAFSMIISFIKLNKSKILNNIQKLFQGYDQFRMDAWYVPLQWQWKTRVTSSRGRQWRFYQRKFIRIHYTVVSLIRTLSLILLLCS